MGHIRSHIFIKASKVARDSLAILFPVKTSCRYLLLLRSGNMKLTFSVPAGATSVAPAVAISMPIPSKAFLLCPSFKSESGFFQTDDSFTNYKWSEGLSSYYEYFGEQQDAVSTQIFPSVFIESDSSSLCIEIKPWQLSEESISQAIKAIVLTFMTPMGTSIVYPNPSE